MGAKSRKSRKVVAILLQSCRKAVAKLSQSCCKVSQNCRKVVAKLSQSCLGLCFANIACEPAGKPNYGGRSLIQAPRKSSADFPGCRSAGPLLLVHSAWACQAAVSSVQEIGPHSSELATRLAWEKGSPCLTRRWRR